MIHCIFINLKAGLSVLKSQISTPPCVSSFYDISEGEQITLIDFANSVIDFDVNIFDPSHSVTVGSSQSAQQIYWPSEKLHKMDSSNVDRLDLHGSSSHLAQINNFLTANTTGSILITYTITPPLNNTINNQKAPWQLTIGVLDNKKNIYYSKGPFEPIGVVGGKAYHYPYKDQNKGDSVPYSVSWKYQTSKFSSPNTCRLLFQPQSKGNVVVEYVAQFHFNITKQVSDVSYIFNSLPVNIKNISTIVNNLAMIGYTSLSDWNCYICPALQASLVGQTQSQSSSSANSSPTPQQLGQALATAYAKANNLGGITYTQTTQANVTNYSSVCGGSCSATS